MKLTDQVCMVDQAQRLKALGVAQEGIYYWYTGDTGINVDHLLMKTGSNADPFNLCFSAFSTAELGAMCRDCISGPITNAELSEGFYATPDEYAKCDLDSTVPDDEPLIGPVPWYSTGLTQAQALAALLIWLLETRLLTAEEVNTRLKQ